MLFGDIERLLAQLYPHRTLIAVGVVVAAAVLAYVAWRRRWLDVVGRHRRGSAGVLIVVLVVGLPIAWVLGSPLFIRTQLVEAGPVVAAPPSAGPGSSPDAPQPRVVLRGEFAGADEFHFGSGTALLIETEPGRYSLRFEGFTVRNGPDLFVYLSPDAAGYADGAIELGALKATDGAFGYEVPPGTDVSGLRSAVIWCRAFSVQFAAAPLAVG